MSQIEIKELQTWLADPTTQKFKIILANLRKKVLEEMSQNYIRQDHFRNDLILSSLGGCEAIQNIVAFLDKKKPEEIEILAELFYGGKHE